MPHYYWHEYPSNYELSDTNNNAYSCQMLVLDYRFDFLHLLRWHENKQ